MYFWASALIDSVIVLLVSQKISLQQNSISMCSLFAWGVERRKWTFLFSIESSHIEIWKFELGFKKLCKNRHWGKEWNLIWNLFSFLMGIFAFNFAHISFHMIGNKSCINIQTCNSYAFSSVLPISVSFLNQIKQDFL